jgi:hypothetical protein
MDARADPEVGCSLGLARGAWHEPHNAMVLYPPPIGVGPGLPEECGPWSDPASLRMRAGIPVPWRDSHGPG